MPRLDNETLLLAFVALTALFMMAQAILLLAILLSVRKSARKLLSEFEDLRSSVMPIVYNARELMTRLTPKIESTIDNLAEIASTLREQSANVESQATEIMERVRHQTGRLDAMVSGVLDAVDRAGGFVAEAVGRPVRQLTAMMASVKAIVESLRGPAPEPRSTHTPGD